MHGICQLLKTKIALYTCMMFSMDMILYVWQNPDQEKKSECFQDLSQDYMYLAILVIIYIARSDCKVLQVYSVYIYMYKKS